MFRRRAQLGPIAIDVGNRRVRMIQLMAEGKQLRVVGAGEAATVGPPPTPREHFALQEPVIRKLLRAGRFVGRSVVSAVPLTGVRVKTFRLPCMPEEDLTRAVRFEAAERFPSLDEDPEVRYLKAGSIETGQGEQFELIVMAAGGDVVRSHLEAVRAAGFESLALDLGPAATFRTFERFLLRVEDAEQVTAFLDLGYSGSRFLIAVGSEIAVLRLFDIGVGAFEKAIGDGLSIPPEEARQMYERTIPEPEAESDTEDERSRAVLAAMQPQIDQLAKEIGLCLRYFSVTFRGRQVEGVTCVGGGARHGGVQSRLAEVLGIPVRTGHALRSITTEDRDFGVDRRSGLPEWATAVGMALRGMVSRSRGAAPAVEAAG
jgi:type IV pilus assembly protein PilM